MTINGHPLSIAEIEAIVSTDPKRRYSLSDGRIRACQGHSIAIDLGLAAAMPPEVLFHGTAKQSIESIRREGLRPIQRRYVHLSINEETAAAVGTRHGAPIVLTVNAAAMLSDGHVFLVSENGVWLVEHVPPQYLRGNSFVPD